MTHENPPHVNLDALPAPTGEPLLVGPPVGDIPLGGIDPTIAHIEPNPSVLVPEITPVLSPFEANADGGNRLRKILGGLGRRASRAAGAVPEDADTDPSFDPSIPGAIDLGAIHFDATTPPARPTYSAGTPPPYVPPAAPRGATFDPGTPPPYVPGSLDLGSIRFGDSTPPPPPPPRWAPGFGPHDAGTPPPYVAPDAGPRGETAAGRAMREEREAKALADAEAAAELHEHQQKYDERLEKVHINEALRMLASSKPGEAPVINDPELTEYLGPGHSLGKITIPEGPAARALPERTVNPNYTPEQVMDAMKVAKEQPARDYKEYLAIYDRPDQDAWKREVERLVEKRMELRELKGRPGLSDTAREHIQAAYQRVSERYHAFYPRLSDNEKDSEKQRKLTEAFGRWRDDRDKGQYVDEATAAGEIATAVGFANWQSAKAQEILDGFSAWLTERDAQDYRSFLAENSVTPSVVSFERWKDGELEVPSYNKQTRKFEYTKVGVRHIKNFVGPDADGMTVNYAGVLFANPEDMSGRVDSGYYELPTIEDHPSWLSQKFLDELLGNRKDTSKTGDPVRTRIIDSWDLASMKAKLEELKSALAEQAAAKPGEAPVAVKKYPKQKERR